MSSLFHQKTAIPMNFKTYHSDGTGRDIYIAVNNGGQSKQKLDSNQVTKHNVFKFTKSFNYPKNLSISQKVSNYQPDGTGRDAYIQVNQGGQINDYSKFKESNNMFRSTLRSYQSINLGSWKPDYFAEGQLKTTSKSQNLKDKSISKIQFNVTSRLTKQSQNSFEFCNKPCQDKIYTTKSYQRHKSTGQSQRSTLLDIKQDDKQNISGSIKFEKYIKADVRSQSVKKSLIKNYESNFNFF